MPSSATCRSDCPRCARKRGSPFGDRCSREPLVSATALKNSSLSASNRKRLFLVTSFANLRKLFHDLNSWVIYSTPSPGTVIGGQAGIRHFALQDCSNGQPVLDHGLCRRGCHYSRRPRQVERSNASPKACRRHFNLVACLRGCAVRPGNPMLQPVRRFRPGFR